MGPNVKLSHPDKAGANLVKVSCRRESPQPGRAAGKGWLQRLVRTVLLSYRHFLPQSLHLKLFLLKSNGNPRSKNDKYDVRLGNS